jgi:acetyl-CoA carboxylase carboxyl transferase subunit alpha
MTKTSERRVFLLDFEKPLYELEEKINQIRELAQEENVDVSEQLAQLESRADQLRQEIFGNLNPSQQLQLARHPRRPSTLDYIQAIADDWFELHGDRCGYDDPALVGGVARLEGRPVVILGHQKGRDTKDNVARNFGMPAPGGYRKALRLMEHAEQFGMPIITFIDTPGAWAGVDAEKLGQGEAIAYNLRQMYCHWRRRIGGSLGHWCGRPRFNVRTRRLYRRHPRSLCRNPLERCQKIRQSRDRPQNHF